jgi:hypothetical protein
MTQGSSGRSGYTASTWRSGHPSWNGGYYYNGGAYYYDSAFAYPAIVDNEWSSIATLAGGVAIIGLLDNDPTLVFAGTVGAVFAISAYDADLNSSDRELRLRADYFQKPYFWRNGVRFDRTVVMSNGVRSYQFRRH